MKQSQQITAPDGAEDLMSEYALAEAKLQQAKDAMTPLRKKVVAMFPADSGDYTMKAGKWAVEVSVPVKVKWDADELTAHYGAALPAHVKRSLSISEADFKRLPSEEREALSKAREFSSGSAKIDLAVAK